MTKTFPLIKITTSMFDSLYIINSVTNKERLQHDPYCENNKIQLTNDMYLSRRHYYYPSELKDNILHITATTAKEFNDPKNNVDRYIIPYHNQFIITKNHSLKHHHNKMFVPNKTLTQYDYWRLYKKDDKLKNILYEHAKRAEIIEAFINEQKHTFISKNKDITVFLDNYPLPKLDCYIKPIDIIELFSNNTWIQIPPTELLYHNHFPAPGITYLPTPPDTYVRIKRQDFIKYYYVNNNSELIPTNSIPVNYEKRDYLILNNHNLTISL